MRFLVLFQDEQTTTEMINLLKGEDFAGLTADISAVGFQCQADALTHMGLLCTSCPLHVNSQVGLEFILVDNFFLHAFEIKLRFMEALDDNDVKRFADSSFQFFDNEELSAWTGGVDGEVAVDVLAALKNRITFLILDALL